MYRKVEAPYILKILGASIKKNNASTSQNLIQVIT